MRKILSLISVALPLFSWSATADIPSTSVQEKVEEIFNQEIFSSAVVGLLAVNMEGDTLAVFNHKQKMIPASNVKLLTTGLALKYLGAEYRYKTQLAYSGEIVDGVLRGNLYIVGGGDPTTGSRALLARPLSSLFAEWKNILDDAGIVSIEGGIVADPRYFEYSNSENRSWSYDDLGTNYGVGPQGLNFFENAQNFLIKPGSSLEAKPSIEPKYPETPWMKFHNRARTSAARSANTVYLTNSHLAPVAEFSGSFPIDRKGGYTYEGSNRFGALTCAYYFYNYLSEKGMSVGAYDYVDADNCLSRTGDSAVHQDSLILLSSTYSAKLSAIISETNRESDNFFAETLLRSMAKVSKVPYNDDFGVKAAEKLLASYGLETGNDCQLFDGSGLSRKNYINADFFVRFLSMMAKDKENYPVYLASLPSPQSKGTLEYKFPDAPVEFCQRIKMKSGSMDGVRCYSGYILSSDSDPAKTIVFSLLTNNVTASSWTVNPKIDAIIEALAAEN